jgi:FkbM family methyltransferase
VLSAHAVIVDVGANIGLFSLAVLRSIPGSRVHMFEPSPIPQRCLAASLARNGLQERAALNAMALYSEPGELEFYVHDGKHSAYDGIRDTRYDWVGSPRPIRVPATTLDQYCQAAGLDRIDLLKIDAEGAELFVLRGAEQTLRTLRPLVLFEIGRKNLAPYGIQPAEVHEFLTARGYHVQTLRGERLDVPGFDRAVGWEHEFAAVPVPPQ